jgi:four helix bundle protein
VSVYRETKKFPREECFGLTSQIRRASAPIAANIAEGAGRDSSKEFARFLSNAQGSASELATELLIAERLKLLDTECYVSLNSKLDSIGRMIFDLSRHLKNRR